MNDIHTEFEKIYRASFPSLSKYVLFRVAQASDMEDLLQNVYTDFYRNVLMKKKEVNDVDAYLMQMTQNELKKYYRFKKKAPITLIDEDDNAWVQEIPDADNPHLHVIERSTLEEIETALKRLDFPQQQVLIAKLKLEMTFAEIALSLRVNENTIKARYYRALERLQKEVDQ